MWYWIIGIVVVSLLYQLLFVEKVYIPKEERLFRKVFKKAKEFRDNFTASDPKEWKKLATEQIEEIEADHELFLRLSERLRYRKDKLKNMRADYYDLLHCRDEIDTMLSIDPPAFEKELKELQIKIEEIGKRFRSYGLENSEP